MPKLNSNTSCTSAMPKDEYSMRRNDAEKKKNEEILNCPTTQLKDWAIFKLNN
jgi:hypothetical protein